jgi:Fur family ferric uptake transcriptional regulator
MSSQRGDIQDAADARAQWTELLRSRGLRVTGPRVAVLDVLEKRSHLSAEEVAAEVRARHGTVSTQAVYDVLHTLSSVGLLRAIEPAGSATRYERRVGDNHHHLVCRQCGSVHDVPCVTGAAPCLEPSETAGFRVDEAEVTFWGICPDCQHRSSTKES